MQEIQAMDLYKNFSRKYEAFMSNTAEIEASPEHKEWLQLLKKLHTLQSTPEQHEALYTQLQDIFHSSATKFAKYEQWNALRNEVMSLQQALDALPEMQEYAQIVVTLREKSALISNAPPPQTP